MGNCDSFMDITHILDDKDNQILNKKEIGTGILSDKEPKLKDNLFCVGNPSNINSESDIEESNDFDPKIFHLSFGNLESENKTNNDDVLGGYGHTCWGHSGAPIFNTKGHIIGLHNAWNDETGLRH